MFIKNLNKIKVPDWSPVFAGKGINIPLIKRLRTGIENVPYDEMFTVLHKGEIVLDKDDEEEYRDRKKTYNSDDKNNSSKVTNIYNQITIEKMEVRDEKDIEKVAEELYFLTKRSEV